MLTKLPRTLQTTMKKQNQNTTRAWHQQTRTRCNPHNKKTHSTVRKHTDAGTQRFRPRNWCQNSTTNRSRRNHLRNCLRKKKKKNIIDTQTNKNAMTQESLCKKMTNRTLACTAGLPPRPHVQKRHHETTHDNSTNTTTSH